MQATISVDKVCSQLHSHMVSLGADSVLLQTPPDHYRCDIKAKTFLNDQVLTIQLVTALRSPRYFKLLGNLSEGKTHPTGPLKEV